MVKIFLSKGEKSLISELLLNALNTEYGLSLTDTDIKIDDNGKLCVKNCPFKFSASHSKDNLAVAISEKNVGIDIEVVKTDFNPRPIFGVTPANAEDCAVLWTKAESLVKLYSNDKLDLRKICLNDAPTYNGVNLDANLYTFINDNVAITVATTDDGYQVFNKEI
jgi:hypothetical protein